MVGGRERAITVGGRICSHGWKKAEFFFGLITKRYKEDEENEL
jgi:hypothetical protein